MIDERISSTASDFCLLWNSILSEFPRFRLDLSWPTVGTIDLILHDLRGKRRLNSADKQRIRGASAYLGIMAYNCWSAYPGNPDVRLSCSGAQEEEIRLEILRGPNLRLGESFHVEIYSTLLKLLSDPPNPLPAFADSTHYLTPEINIITLFAAGLVSGLCPYGKGPWSSISINEFEAQLNACAEALAESAASYYALTYPAEPLGASTVLYNPHLVLPPSGYREEYPGQRASAALIAYLKERSVGNDAAEHLCHNLASLPESTASLAGFAVSAAYSDAAPSERLRALSYSRRISGPLIRNTVCIARTLLKRESSWIAHLRKGRFQDALKAALRERDLGLMPLYYLDDPLVLELPAIADLCQLLASSMAAEAAEYLEIYLSAVSEPPELVLQAAFLELALGRPEGADELIKKRADKWPNPSPAAAVRLCELQGLIADRRGDHLECIRRFESALRHPPRASHRIEHISLHLARYYYRKGDAERARSHAERALLANPGNLSALVINLMTRKAVITAEAFKSELSAATLLGCKSPEVFTLLYREAAAEALGNNEAGT